MKKDVAIFTLPLHNNFGGIIQAWALQNALKKLGFSSELVFLRSAYELKKEYFKSLVKKYVLGFLPQYKGYKIIKTKKNNLEFIEKNFIKSKAIFSKNELYDYAKNTQFDAWILGSDQVFRPSYFSTFRDDFALDFVESKKISYAASFGSSSFEGNAKASKIKDFRALSVREKDAKKLCYETFGKKAALVLDPTLLLEKSDYLELLEKNPSKELGYKKDEFLFAYILDKNEQKLSKINELAQKYQLKVLSFGEQDGFDLPTWLWALNNAKCVLSDSFHGCVFSMIFGKDFLAFYNDLRGNSRFESLFSALGVKEYLKNGDISSIDYERLAARLEHLRSHSLAWLKAALKG